MRIGGRHPGQGDESTLYLWIVPAEARGEWRSEQWHLHIYQNYQEIDVEAKLGGRTVALTEAKLSGSELTWEAEGARFSGRVEGTRIVGELVEWGSSRPVIFVRTRTR
jgi:hypothetical protein